MVLPRVLCPVPFVMHVYLLDRCICHDACCHRAFDLSYMRRDLAVICSDADRLPSRSSMTRILHVAYWTRSPVKWAHPPSKALWATDATPGRGVDVSTLFR